MDGRGGCPHMVSGDSKSVELRSAEPSTWLGAGFGVRLWGPHMKDARLSRRGAIGAPRSFARKGNTLAQDGKLPC